MLDLETRFSIIESWYHVRTRDVTLVATYIMSMQAIMYHRQQKKWYPPKVFTWPFRSYTRI